MKYDQDPVRWTESPLSAPELLRAPLRAACNEGPSDLQMKALALKLAALSAGGAAAATAATAKASTTASGTAAAASAGAFSVGKMIATVALLGAAATGAVVWQTGSAPRDAGATTVMNAQPVVIEAQPLQAGTPEPTVAPVVQAAPEPAVEQLKPATQVEPTVEPMARVEADAVPPRPEAQPQARPTATATRAKQSRSASATPAKVHVGEAASSEAQPQNSAAGATVGPRVAPAGQPSEVELLRRARSLLSARPREAFSLTEAHRDAYPNGLFAQERDALAVEALVRAGETDKARSLAERFVRAYPNSPHAHRFREAMGIR